MSDYKEAVKAYEQAQERRRQTATPRTLAATEVEYTADLLISALAERVGELERENEQLKCCAQCVHLYGAGAFCNADSPTGSSRKVYFSDPCHFTPSRWTERGTL